jgi:apolipoprotein N-acyltransferase
MFQIALIYALFAALFALLKHPLARALALLPLTYFFILLVRAVWELLAAPFALLATAAAVAVYVGDVALMFAQLDED